MRILIINDVYEKIGGTEIYVHNIVTALKKAGHEVFFFSFGKTSFSDNNTLVCKESSALLKKIYGLTINLLAYSQLKKFISRINPDVIHLNNIDMHIATILLACRGKKLVRTIHDFGIVCPNIPLSCVIKKDLSECEGGMGVKCIGRGCIPIIKYPFYRFLFGLKYHLMKKYVKLYIAPSKKLIKYLECAGFEKVVYLPLLIDVKLHKKTPAKKINKLLYVGRLEYNKGIIQLLDTSKLLKDNKIDFSLNIIGEGSLKKYAERFISENKLDNVKIMGVVNHDRVQSYFREMDILIFPSIWMEQFGIVGIEAMANSMPVIASNRGGITDWLIDGYNGLLVKPGDTAELYFKIKKLIQNAQLYKKLSTNCYKFVKNYPNDKEHIKELLKIYKI
jgi:glycosyltransferase involved in cell wall biosynthesis